MRSLHRTFGILAALPFLGAACKSASTPGTMDQRTGGGGGGGGSPYDKPGFTTVVQDGRLWVFRAGSKEWDAFAKHGEPAKCVIRPRAGPAGMTIKAPDGDTILEYVASKPGFVTLVRDGRLWIFREGAKELDTFRKQGELAKHVVRPKAGPLGATLKAPDSDTILEYAAAQPGFVTFIRDGRVWVFREGAKELDAFRSQGELAKHVVRPKAGPLGVTLKAPDSETADAYLAAASR